MPEPAQPAPRAAGELETVQFIGGGRVFDVTLIDGQLKVIVTGRRNGRMLIQPDSNTSITITSEHDGPRRP